MGNDDRCQEIYIHVPFCVRKCAYCDFLSMSADGALQEKYFAALEREIAEYEDLSGYPVSSVFIGGGTPSVVPAGMIAHVLDKVRENFRLLPDAEISMEANPGTVTDEKLGIYRQAGINRLSLGLQSASDKELKILGRIHTFDQFLDSFSRCRRAGFDNLNVDLMSALPSQTVSSWKNTLKEVLRLRPEHISAYSLIIEEGTPFYERYKEAASARDEGREQSLLPSEEEEREMVHLCRELLEEEGYAQYEISNYALPGRECTHNLGYWTRVPYIGFGLGAASYNGNERLRAPSDMKAYLSGSQRTVEERLGERDKMSEAMILGLRLVRGVSVSSFQEEFKLTPREAFPGVCEKYERLGLLAEKDGRIALTQVGMDLANVVMEEFL